MKDKLKYIGMVLALLFMASCQSDLLEKYDSIQVVGAPSLEISVSNVQDSTFNLNYTLGAAGWLSVTLLKGDENPVPSENNMKFKNTPSAVKTYHFEVEADVLTAILSIGGLEQDSEYQVFAMATSVDGVSGEVKDASFQTSDVYKPLLVSTTPAVSGTADKALNFSVTLNFNEPVIVDKAASIFFRYLNIVTFEIVDHPAEVTFSGKQVVAKQTHTPIPGQWVFLTVLDDAVKDRVGNFYAGIQSGLTEAGALAGLYWRTAFAPHAHISVLPTLGVAVQDVNFKIELTYGLTMDFRRNPTTGAILYAPGDILISYKAGSTTVTTEVPQANVAFDGVKVTITPPRTPVYGETVSIQIKENAFRTRYGSPVAKIDFGTLNWLVSYGYVRSLIIGDFNVTYINHENVTLGTEPATIEAGTAANAIVIKEVAKNYFGIESDLPINGTFNGDFATIAVPDWQLMGNISISGGTIPGKIYFANRFSEDPVIGNIASDGDIVMNGWGFYFVADAPGTTVGWLARFNSTEWDKVTVKSSDSAAIYNGELILDFSKRIRR